MYDGELNNDAPLLFDYDGDGEPEIFVHATEYEKRPEAGGSEWAYLYTFRDGAIVRYPPVANVDLSGTPVDVDHDGRPDLFTHAGVFVQGGPPDGCEPQQYAARFLVHSLADGSFSITDGVAKAYARKRCPAPPAAIDGLEDAACARLWASRPETLASERRRVAASCVETANGACDDETVAGSKAVHECHLRTGRLRRTPPVHAALTRRTVPLSASRRLTSPLSRSPATGVTR